MNKVLLLTVAVVALLGIGIAAFVLLGTPKEPLPDDRDPSFPSGGMQGGPIQSGGDTFVIADYDDEPIEVRDFRTNPDPFVPGHYTIASDSRYDVFYQETDDYFGITLYAEPLGETRTHAQGELQGVLGITEDEMCRLNYVVAPGPGIAEVYEGSNLGFSFCPGATVLPQ